MTPTKTYRQHPVPDDLPAWKVHALLAALLVFAAGLRLLGIGDRVLWYDELYSAAFAIQPIGDLLQSVRAHDPHPPLYYLQLHPWLKLGMSDAWLRLNSLVWSLLAIVPAFFVGRRLFGVSGGLWAALILCISPTAIFFGQEVRMYAMQMSLVAFNLLFLERLLARDHGRFDLPLFFLTLLAACYVQGAGFLLLLPVSVYILLRLGRDLWSGLGLKLGLAAGLAALCALPWLLQARGTRLDHLRIWDFHEIPGVLLQLLLGPEAEAVSPGMSLLFLLICCVVLVGLIRLPGTRALTIAYVLVAFGAILALAYLVTPLWHINAMAGLLPVLSVIIGGALAAVFDRFGRRPWAAAVMTGGLLAGFLPHAVTVNGPGDAFRRMNHEAAEYLLQETRPGDRIEIADWRDLWTLGWYLSGPDSVPVDTERRVIAVAEDRQVTMMAEDGAPEPGTWRVERNADWRDPASRAQWTPVGAEHFARFVIYRQP